MLTMQTQFEKHYETLWGDRWPNLREALLREKNYLAVHSYCAENDQTPYYMDQASHTIISVLAIKKGEDVLDMCAAPGGKSMVIANALQGTGSLWVNDKERHGRLNRVIKQFFPGQPIRITAKDGRTMGQIYPERMDAILIDAPCSSEWHWLKEPEMLNHWRPTRAKRLAIDQYALLASALMLLKIGGRCLYVTCAINPHENESVIKKALKRWGDAIQVDNTVPHFAEPCEYGFYILPDVAIGGPLYGCLLWRRV